MQNTRVMTLAQSQYDASAIFFAVTFYSWHDLWEVTNVSA